MLFDLKGKRRRVVQATYLTLAVLMGGGLVLFGIGGDVSGGIADIFTSGGGDGDDSGNKQIEERIEKAEKKLQSNPNDQASLKIVVRDNYNLAQADFDEAKNAYGKEGKQNLEDAVAGWKLYEKAAKGKLDPSLASTAVQAYTALNQNEQAARTLEIAIADRKEPQPYLQLVQLWTLAGDTRRADLAGRKAVALAPKEQRKEAEAAVQQAKQAATQPQTQGAQGGQQQGPDPGGVKAE